MSEAKPARLDAGTRGAVPEPDLHAAGHGGEAETFDLEIDIRAITKIGIWLVGIIVVSMILMGWLVVVLKRSEVKTDRAASPALQQAIDQQLDLAPPGPRLQPSPASDLRPEAELDAFLEEQRQALESYGWVSKEGGIVHIPINRAIADLAKKGLSAPRPTGEVVTFPPAASSPPPAQAH